MKTGDECFSPEDSRRWEGERLPRQEEIASNLLNASQSRDINHAIHEAVNESASDF